MGVSVVSSMGILKLFRTHRIGAYILLQVSETGLPLFFKGNDTCGDSDLVAPASVLLAGGLYEKLIKILNFRKRLINPD